MSGCTSCSKDLDPNMRYLSAEKFVDRDFLTLMQFAYYTDEDAFKRAFSPYGVEIEHEDDLVELVSIAETGEYEGQPVEMNVLEIFKTIEIDNSKALNTTVRLTDLNILTKTKTQEALAFFKGK